MLAAQSSAVSKRPIGSAAGISSETEMGDPQSCGFHVPYSRGGGCEERVGISAGTRNEGSPDG